MPRAGVQTTLELEHECELLRTGQATVYAARDDADMLKGIAKAYNVLTAGQYSGTTAVYLPTLARADIAFVNATSKITAAAGLDVVKSGDVIRIRGSAGNDTEYTVLTGNVATEIVLTTQPVEEASGAWITIAKQALQSNNCVVDLSTKKKKRRIWLRYGSYSATGLLGAASDGKLLWTATAVSIHAANNDLQMLGGTKGTCTVKIIGGAGEVARYWAGYTYSFDGFANAVNKLPGFRCTTVAVNGADLDITLNTGNLTAISEAAGVNGAVYLSCNGILGFCNACIAAGVGGYSDWRVSNKNEFESLMDYEAPTCYPDVAAFPSTTSTDIATSTTDASAVANYLSVALQSGVVASRTKTTPYHVMLVRGGN